jgi:hypothetical protein
MTLILEEQAPTQVLSHNDSPWFTILFAMHVDAGANPFLFSNILAIFSRHSCYST